MTVSSYTAAVPSGLITGKEQSLQKNKNLRFSYFVINTHRPKISGKTAKEKNIAVFRIVLKQSLVRKRPKNQKWTELLTEKSLEKIRKKRKFSEFQSPFSQPPKNVAHWNFKHVKEVG